MSLFEVCECGLSVSGGMGERRQVQVGATDLATHLSRDEGLESLWQKRLCLCEAPASLSNATQGALGPANPAPKLDILSDLQTLEH
jgi:hypothetical protein